MDATPILLITIPMFLPVIQQLGISTLQFGIVMCTAVCIGFVTPPFGTCLFTGMSVSGVSMQKLVKVNLPFIISMLVVLLFNYIYTTTYTMDCKIRGESHGRCIGNV